MKEWLSTLFCLLILVYIIASFLAAIIITDVGDETKIKNWIKSLYVNKNLFGYILSTICIIGAIPTFIMWFKIRVIVFFAKLIYKIILFVWSLGNKKDTKNTKIKRGDFVTVENTRYTYVTLSGWSGLEGYGDYYCDYDYPPKECLYKVVNVKKHFSKKRGEKIAIIQNMDDLQVYVIDIKGLIKK